MSEFGSFDELRKQRRMGRLASPKVQRTIRFGKVVLEEADQVARAMQAKKVPFNTGQRGLTLADIGEGKTLPPNPIALPQGWMLNLIVSCERKAPVISSRHGSDEIEEPGVYDWRNYFLTPGVQPLRFIISQFEDGVGVEDFAAPIEPVNPNDRFRGESDDMFHQRVARVRGALVTLAERHNLNM